VKKAYTVTGPGVDKTVSGAGIGLSAALTFASRATRKGVEGSFYVRDPDGKVVGRADSDGTGNVNCYGKQALDRAPSGPPLPSLKAASRSAVGRKPTTGGATLQGERAETRVASEAPPAPTTKEDSVTTTTEKKPTQQEGSEDLAAALIAAVKEKVEGVETPTNPSGMTRLLVGKKTFGYLEKARKTGQPVKIPKPLLAVEGDLPSGHGFHKTKWGLVRTVTKKSEIPKVAASLAVAAAAVQTPAEEPAAA